MFLIFSLFGVSVFNYIICRCFYRGPTSPQTFYQGHLWLCAAIKGGLCIMVGKCTPVCVCVCVCVCACMGLCLLPCHFDGGDNLLFFYFPYGTSSSATLMEKWTSQASEAQMVDCISFVVFNPSQTVFSHQR